MYIGFYVSCIALACAAWIICRQDQKTCHHKAAPTVRGWPLIGMTISLALHGAAFLHWCRMQVQSQTPYSTRSDQALTHAVLQYGDIFRVSLGGQHMTYLLHPAAIKLFFAAPDEQIAFRQASWHSSLLFWQTQTSLGLSTQYQKLQQNSKRGV